MSIPLSKLKEQARDLIRSSLTNCAPIPETLRARLVIGVLFEGDTRIFEMYVPGDTPEDAIILARVPINALTGQAGSVEVFEERWTPIEP